MPAADPSRFAAPLRAALAGDSPLFADLSPAARVASRPPLPLDPATAATLARHPDRIARRNRRTADAALAESPRLLDLAPARDCLPALASPSSPAYLHPGPPLNPASLPPLLRDALENAWRDDPRVPSPGDGFARTASGQIRLLPAQDFATAIPGPAVVGPDTPVWVVAGLSKRRAYAPAALPPGVSPAPLRRALAARGGLPLPPLLRAALPACETIPGRGNLPASLLMRELLPDLLRDAASPADALPLLEWLASDAAIAGIALAACKLRLDAARDAKGASLVVAAGFNGRDYGIRLAGTASRWFAAPADAARPCCGDDPLLEAAGLGAFALAAAPNAARAYDLSPDGATRLSALLANIAAGTRDALPFGIDALAVARLALPPVLAMPADGTPTLFAPPLAPYPAALDALAAAL